MTRDPQHSVNNPFTRPFTQTVELEDLAQLKRECAEAHASYNAALTTLDATIQQLRNLPPPPTRYDDHQIATLNKHWNLFDPAPTGWRRLVHLLIWPLVGQLFDRQQTFNSTLVDHINRNVAFHREVSDSATSTLTVLHEELVKTVVFQSRLIQFLQQITLYVDTKDRDRAASVAAAVHSLADEMRKRWDSTTAWERRLESKVEDLRSTTAVAHRVAQTLKRELEQLNRSETTPARSEAPSMVTSDASGLSLDSYKYVGFEDAFRGSTDDIRERLASYVPYFQDTTEVLDAGCGRGEFLELLRERGVPSLGIDLNREMVEQCQELGLTVDVGDLLSFLQRQPDKSLGGLFASQVVEHLEPDYLLKALDAAFHKLRPGSKIILETINVASWSAFFESYVRDITHTMPLHPETLRYLVTASGFQKVEIAFKSPCAEQNKLESVPAPRPEDSQPVPVSLKNLIVAFNENTEKLNALMFTDQDYAIIGERP